MVSPRNGKGLVFEPDGAVLDDFLLDRSRVAVIQGPIGCLAGSTLVVTEFGPLPISQIDRPMRVLSWNGNAGRFQLSWCGGSFPKGKDYLVRVSTQQGEFDASAHHRIFGAIGAYLPVENLFVGQSLAACSGDPVGLCSALVLAASSKCDPSSTKKAVSSLAHYAKLARQCGQQPLSEEGVGQEPAPSHGDVPLSISSDVKFVVVRKDDLGGPSIKRSLHDLFGGQIQSDGYIFRHERQHLDAGGPYSVGREKRNVATTQESLQSQAPFGFHLTGELSLACSDSLSLPLSNRAITKLERKRTQEVYWDMQVLDTNNYVTVDGTIHHNSGKTRTVLMRMVLQAQEQPIARNGKRRSRWAAIRDTYPNLRATTIPAFLDMFPEGRALDGGFGKMSWTPPLTYHFVYEPAAVEMEVIFVPMDDDAAVRKMRSLDLTGAWWHEAQYSDLMLIGEVNSRLSRFPSRMDGGAVNPSLLCDMNAPEPNHWVPIMRGDVPMPDFFTPEQAEAHKLYPGWRFFKQPPALVERKFKDGRIDGYVVNPGAENLKYLPEDYYTEAIKGKTKSWIDANCLNRLAAKDARSAVYPEFNADWHVARERMDCSPHAQMVVGMDAGLTPSAIFGQFINGQWRIYEELYYENTGAAAFALHCKRFVQNKFPSISLDEMRWWIDPAGDTRSQSDASTPIQMFRKEGIRVLPAPGYNRLAARREGVKAVLTRAHNGQPGLLINDSCRMLIAGLSGGYQHREVKTSMGMQRLEEAVKNNYSHVVEGFENLLQGAGEMRDVHMGKDKPPVLSTRVKPRLFRNDRPGVFRVRA